MSRYTGPSCRQCRREGTKLFLKGAKCLTEKCPVERRPYPAGQHGQAGGGRPRKASEYAKQLREKQKVKRIYGLTERQFRNTFESATLQPGVKGTNLLIAPGHAMMGLSLGPTTGKIAAQLLSGEATGFDLALLSPDRYDASASSI